MRRISFVLALIALLALCLCACEDHDPLASKNGGAATGDTATAEDTGNGESGTASPAETEYVWTERF